MSTQTTKLPLPGSDLIEQGLLDLEQQQQTIASNLVLIAKSQLHALGLKIPDTSFPEPELGLYRLLQQQHGDGAHSKYNAYRRELLSYIRAARLEAKANASRTL